MKQTQPQGYLAMPKTGTGPGVLVLHAWWGLNDFFRDFCDRLAQEGFVALAPDLFSGKIARTIEEAEQHMTQWNEAQDVPPILLPAVDSLSQHPTVSSQDIRVVGFSLGAYWSLWLAQERPELIRAVVLFYGTNGGGGDFHKSKGAFMGHFAASDLYESADVIEELEKNLKNANRPTTFYTYPGTSHWFFEEDRPEAYNQAAAALAWKRTLAFLKET